MDFEKGCLPEGLDAPFWALAGAAARLEVEVEVEVEVEDEVEVDVEAAGGRDDEVEAA